VTDYVYRGFEELRIPRSPVGAVHGYKKGYYLFFFIDDIVFAFKKKDQSNVKEIVNILKGKFKLEELGEFK